jgi:thiamine biosynthesis lipoprotein
MSTNDQLRCKIFSFTAMASPCKLHLYTQDDSIAEKAMQRVFQLEKKYSRYQDDSVISQINNSAGSDRSIKVDAETAALLNYAATAYDISDGLFDITSGILRQAWDFSSGILPSQNQLNALIQNIGWEKVFWDGENIQLPAGMELDFGGCGKEYAADAAAETCIQLGIKSGLVDLGGDIRVIGPHPDGKPWNIGIRNPDQTEQAMAFIQVEQGAVASSGSYERYMDVDGRRYHHILNPKTGWPARGLKSVSVHTQNCVMAGIISTVAMLKEGEGENWIQQLGLQYIATTD